MLRDFRLAVRVLTARPGFTFVAALSLALGIGANSAIFSLVDAMWFRPLAVPEASRMVRVFGATDQEREATLSYPEYLDIQQQATSLGGVVAIGGRGATVLDGDNKLYLRMNLVSPNFFTALGIVPALGRVFTPQDAPESLVVVLAHSFWERQYGSDPGIVGKQIQVQRGRAMMVTVIGVLPQSFRGIDAGGDRELWFPAGMWPALGDARELQTRGNRWFRVLGRLAPGASAKTAGAQAAAIAQRMAENWPADNRGRRLAVMPDLDYRLERAGTNGLALLAIVLLVVLISSVNVANLLLSRAVMRGREMAVRLALGASRAALIRQLMAENTLLGLAGLLLGLVFGAALTSILPALMVPPPGVHATLDFQFDSRVFVFSLVVSAVTLMFFGLAPAWQSSRPDVIPALKGETALGGAGRRWPLRNWLAVVQIAVSMTLLACSGVLIRSFAHTRTGDLGFGRKPLLLVWLSQDAKPGVYREVIARYEAMPGVRSVAAAMRAPLSLSSNGFFERVAFPGRTEFANAPPFEIKCNLISANFLNTMGTPVLRGRGFDKNDENPGATAVLINERMAQRFWPGEDPLGKTLAVGGKAHTVIGVTKNAPINEVGEPAEPYLYLSYWANFSTEVTFFIETRGDPAALAQAARRELKAVDPRLDPRSITTENDLIRYSAQSYELTAELVGSLGLLGLLLTAVGLYGVISYGVSQRMRELGIRMALGADRGDTLRLVLREAAVLGLAGMAMGLPLALAATRMSAAMLFGVGPWDATVFFTATMLLAGVLLAAGFLPARRATAIDPASALRSS